MEFANNLTRVTALAFGIASALACGQAQASAFQLRENSVKAQGRAMAGSASAYGDASVVANNPAMMSTFKEKTLQADVTAVDLSFEFTGGGNAAAGSALQQPLTGGDGGDAGDLTPVPASAFILPLSGSFEYVTLGMMVSAPFGLKTDYDRNWVGRYHAVESDVRIIDLTLSASLELSERFSVGVGAIIERSDVTLSNAIDFGTGICANPATQSLCFMPNPITGPYGPQKNDGFVSVEGDDTSFGWLFGVSWRPTDRLSLGYTHRSEIKHEVSGTATFEVPANAAFLTSTGQYVTGPGGAKLTLPSTDTFSATFQATDRLAVMAEASLTGWESLEEVRIEFGNPAQPDSAEDYNWGDSWFYSVGAEYKISDRFTVRGGVGRDESPVSLPYRTPRMPDQDRNWYAVGLTWAATDNLEISGSYTRIQLADDPQVDLVSSSGSRLVGTYDGGADLYGISMQYRF
ncbi:OmpP1/FadL family transporter [Pseudoxanthomonas wuyuanensis]|uniref:Long-chain fatty acid transport protein n=1 Tax=Pseudoxanthomonas wuyuanensis TaxID=1073196 RepID=A0A286D9Y8_9GAMM|nr:outer membrane protein transport protein [Pseudoxanthomonas wuyuanensis]SOD55442.1 long-chain fatty acid transport protein [Pseudoxanthomonas wuyuanensis]